VRVSHRILFIFVLFLTIVSTLVLSACQRTTPKPLPVAQTLTRIAAPSLTTTAVTPQSPGATPYPSTPLPTATPATVAVKPLTPTPLPPLPPQEVGLALPAWLLVAETGQKAATFFDNLQTSRADLHLLPTGKSDQGRNLVAQGQAHLALLTDRGDAGSDLLRQVPFVLASHLATAPLDLSLAELRTLFAEQAEGRRRVAVVGDGAIERELLGQDVLRPDATFLSNWPAVREALLADRGMVALLPWAFATPRLRLHPVDGHAFGPDVLSSGYPLVQRWRLTGDATVDPTLWQAIADGLRANFTPPVSLVATGDIMLARNVGKAIAENGVDYPFAATANWLRAADLAFGNLETPLSNAGELATAGIAFRASPSTVEGLIGAGFDVLSLANNHTGDYGDNALLETLRLLEKGGENSIVPLGAGADEAAARKPRIVEVRGLKIAFLARNAIPYGAPPASPERPGTAWLDPAQTLADVQAASGQADVVVLSLHWGNEYTYAVTEEQRTFAQEAIAAGADLILGHHSHNAQAMKIGETWLAAYSLGNFVFDQNWSVESSQGLALHLLLDKTGVRAVEPLAVYVVAGQAHLLDWNEGKSLLGEVLALTGGLSPDVPAPSPDAPWAFQTGGRVTSLTFADLNGDGTRQVIAATGDLEQPGTIHALHGGEQLWQFQAGARVNVVRAANLDTDGRDKVLAATGALDQPSWIYALNKDGTQRWRYTVEAKVEDVIAIDLNDDGRRNEILGAEWGSFDDTIYALGADGTLRWIYETSGTPNCLLSTDLDGNGTPEILIGGDGLYALDRFGNLQWKEKLEAESYVNKMTTADLNGDGKPEVIAGVRYPSPAVAVYNAGGELRWSHPLATSATALTAADLDGDGQPEIVAGTVSGLVTAIGAEGKPRWQAYFPGKVNELAAADLDGNGEIELVVASGDDFTPGGVAILAPDGSPLHWHADAAAVSALYVGQLSGSQYEIVAGSSSGWVYPVDWTRVLPIVPPSTPVVNPTAPPQPTATPGAITGETPSPTPLPSGLYRPTQASYYIEVELDYWGHTLQAWEQLVFTNTTDIPLTNLLLNVPPNRSAGAFTLSSLTVDGNPVTYQLEGTSLWVKLPKVQPPGQEVVLEMAFSLVPPYMRVDSIFGGGSIGYSESAFNAGNWHPVLAPYHAEKGWVVTPWHPVGDPYVTDMGNYVVEIHTSPDVTVVGPGTLESSPDQGRWHFTTPGIRTFAFAASHRYKSATETAYGTTVASYYYPEHQITGQLALANAAAAVRLFSDLYGPYPYPDLRIAETDFSGGQEFSGFMLFGSGTHQGYLDAGGGPRTIFFTLIPHETAHQWWYGVVGNDQAREPWLDEAFAKYSEQLFYEHFYPEHADWRWAWMGMASRQPAPVNVTIYDYNSSQTYKDRVYLTGALLLAQLRQALGDETFFDLLQTHYRQGANRIATIDEFLALLEQFGDPATLHSIVNPYLGQ